MISKGDFIVIHELYEKGYSIRAIARSLKIDRKTVSRKLKENEYTVTKRVITKESKLDRYKGYIIDYINKSNYRIPSSVILKDIKEMGYTGGLSILQDFLKTAYQQKTINKDPLVRFETKPGEQAQVDWTTIRSGQSPIYAFVMTLGYSRASFVYFTDNMTDDTLIACHELAFLYFGGIPKHVLYDNMKSVVITRNCYGKGKHKYNSLLSDFAKKQGFNIRLCRPYRAKTKGKVERFNSYLKANFYRPLIIKLNDSNIPITHQVLNNHISPWLTTANNRTHATTNKKPSELLKVEQHYLLNMTSNNDTKNNIYRNYIVPEVIVTINDLHSYDELLRRSS